MENKNLPTIRQSTEVALSRANTLMDMADKILAKQSTDLVDESWMERLWQWADDNYNDISDEVLPRDRERLVNLTCLNLNGCYSTYGFVGPCIPGVAQLPKEIGNLVNLTELRLGANQLTKLPKEIGNLVNLTSLNLIGNQLTELPKEIGNLVNLKDLYLSRNQLIELPKEIGKLVNLEVLYLDYNQLTKLEIGNLVCLMKVSLNYNELIEYPDVPDGPSFDTRTMMKGHQPGYRL